MIFSRGIVSCILSLHTSIGWISLGTIFIILTVLLLMYSHSQKKKHHRLKKETHHRLKNNMQMFSSILSLQERFVNEDKTALELQETKNRYGALGQLNKCILQAKEGIIKEIKTKDFTNTLLSHFKNQYDFNKSPKVTVVIDKELKHLCVRKVIPLGLIINEIFLCIIKHELFNSDAAIEIIIQKKHENSELQLLNPYCSEKWMQVTERAISRNIIFKLAEQLETSVDIDISDGLRFSMPF